MNKWKAWTVLSVFVMGVVILKLFYVQIVQHNYWVAEAAAQHMAESEIVAKRGKILMMDGEEMVPVVMNEAVYTVIVDPKESKKEEVEKVLSEKAGEYVTADFETVFSSGLRYYIVARNVPIKVALEIRAEVMAGVWFKEETKRVYIEGTTASQLIGFVNSEGKGQYGVEGALDAVLAGKNGLLKSIVDVNNVELSIGDENIEVAAEDGKDVVLTVDRNVQIEVEKILAKAVSETPATNAAAVVLNPNTGEVMAMASVPNYNASEYYKVADAREFTNYVTEVPYEPASVCKSFVFSAGINEGVMTPETRYLNTGYTVVDEFSIKNASPNFSLGWMSLQKGLAYSFNTSSIQVLCLLGGDPNCAGAGGNSFLNEKGREKMYEYYHDRFGLGEVTGIELYEARGAVPGPYEYEAANNLTYANMTFGQGLNLTMIQVAAAFSSIINGGKYYTPTIVKGYIDSAGNYEAKTSEFVPVRETISEESSNIMREMLFQAREEYHDFYGFNREGYYLGGKTGTGQVIIRRSDGTWGYSDADGETIASYVGFGGRNGEKPAFVVMVKLWGEGQHIDGTRNAQPVFGEIAYFLESYLKI